MGNRELIPKVIDETLRFEPTGHATARYTARDVEFYGTTVPAGRAIPKKTVAELTRD